MKPGVLVLARIPDAKDLCQGGQLPASSPLSRCFGPCRSIAAALHSGTLALVVHYLSGEPHARRSPYYLATPHCRHLAK